MQWRTVIRIVTIIIHKCGNSCCYKSHKTAIQINHSFIPLIIYRMKLLQINTYENVYVISLKKKTGVTILLLVLLFFSIVIYNPSPWLLLPQRLKYSRWKRHKECATSVPHTRFLKSVSIIIQFNVSYDES